MNLHTIRQRAARQRSRLFRSFIAELPRPLRIVDLGGSFDMWQRWGIGEQDGLEVVLLNNHSYDVSHRGKTPSNGFISERIGDVRALRAEDLSAFDVVFSNSMLEHLYTRDAQQSVAREVATSGKPFFIQVPNRHSPIDPHFPHPLAPFFAVWPRQAQATALSLHALGSGTRSASRRKAMERLDNYVLISYSHLQRWFPQARIVTEWSLGLPMSLVAIQRAVFRSLP